MRLDLRKLRFRQPKLVATHLCLLFGSRESRHYVRANTFMGPDPSSFLIIGVHRQKRSFRVKSTHFGGVGAALGAATNMLMCQSAPSFTNTIPKLPDCVFPACSPEPVNWNSPTLHTASPIEWASLIFRVSVVQPALIRAAIAFSTLAWPLRTPGGPMKGASSVNSAATPAGALEL